MTVELHFDHGTLTVPTLPASHAHPALQKDARTGAWRAPAHAYAAIREAWVQQQLPFIDRAAAFKHHTMRLQSSITPYPYQRQALDAWRDARGRGTVVMPTGSGKTWLAMLAMVGCEVPTLVVVPTLDLLQQWQSQLMERFGQPVGVLGGGQSVREAITVATYDSAALQTEFLGNHFGLLICDECHHLPAPSYQFIAAGNIAPFRLGLTATLDRADGGEAYCHTLLGPVCHSVSAADLEGTYLAPYVVQRIEVSMTADEQAAYQQARDTYLGFVRRNNIFLGGPRGWAQFIMRCSQSDAGREALRAYRAQRRMAVNCSGKIQSLWDILARHRHERIIIFTDDNETVYRLSKQFLLPVITHQTKLPERRALLQAFAAGDLPALITARVLNEGVDVPDANVGVVLAGSGSVREHVQRLGRILRRRPGKEAILYEICSATNAERGISDRRRQHPVYQGRAC